MQSAQANKPLLSEQTPWSLEEAALLIDVYPEWREKSGRELMEFSRIISDMFRTLALDKGYIITEKYRNVNTINSQLTNLMLLFTDGEKELTPGSKIFQKAYTLYRNDRRKFDEVVLNIKNIIGEKTNTLASSENIAAKIPALPIDSTDEAEPVTERAQSDPTFREEERDKITLTGKIPWSLEEAALLIDAYPEWSEKSGQEAMAFVHIVSDMFRTLAVIKGCLIDEIYRNVNGIDLYFRSAMTLFTDGKKGLPNPPKILQKAYALYRNDRPKFDEIALNAKNLIGLNTNVPASAPALIETIEADSEDELPPPIPPLPIKEPVRREEPPTSVIPSAAKPRSKLAEIIVPYVRECGLAGCSMTDMHKKFMPYNSLSDFKQLIEGENSIVELPEDRIVHRDNIVDVDEAADAMLKILNSHFAQFDGYSNIHLFFDAAQIELHMFINDNDFDDEETIYALAKHFFVKEGCGGRPFYFSGGTHIWKQEPDYPNTLHGLLINRARRNGGFLSGEDAESFAQKIKLTFAGLTQVLQLQKAAFLQYEKGEYLLSEALGIDKAWELRIKKALDDLLADAEFIVPRDIRPEWYRCLPPLPGGTDWTPLLLQDVLKKHEAVAYKAISAMSGQRYDILCAAIVPKSSHLESFADIVHSWLRSKWGLPMNTAGEALRQLLCESGMISGNELISNMHKALVDHRFAWRDSNKNLTVLDK
ncbi:hypothetical protein FACS1894167_11500 [Synergistales bacterium]|nr:hypothetical protein FACS1894167_11500 [Synergistales bacterium]